MLDLYLTVLNMSLTAGLAALIIIILRASLGKVLPRTFSYALWAIVLYRMVCPISFPSIFSMLGSIKSGIDMNAVSLTEALNFKALSGHREQELVLTPNLLQEAPIETTGEFVPTQVVAAPVPTDYFTVAVIILWILGILALLIFNAVHYRRLCKSMSTSTFFDDQQLVKECKAATRMHRRVDVYESDKVESPFVYGIFRPRVMLPASAAHSLDGQEREQIRHILLHEFYHIKRFDYLVKPLAFLGLCVHWFNPALWVSFRLFDKDMEMSCDEGAVKALTEGTGEDYAATLLNMASNRGGIGKSCALAFRETNAGERVKHIVKYKKPGLAAGAISVILIIICAVGLLSNPASLAEELEDGQANILVMCSAEGTDFTDTILLVGYNDQRKEANIAFLPRDLGVLPDDGSSGTAGRKLSSYASTNPPEEVMKRLGEMLGIDIHNYIKLDTGGFRNLVDALGGVEFNVPMKMVYEDPSQNLSINLEKGKQVLDGREAEMLVRFRKGYPEGDLGRIKVQKAFLKAMIEQKSDIKIGSAKEIYQLLSQGMETDLDLEKAKKLITLFRTAKTIGFVDVPVQPDSDGPFAILQLAPEAKEEVKTSFASSDDSGNQIEEKLLDENISMIMPDGQITLNPNPVTENAWDYGWGSGSFYVSGKDIARVTYSLKNGTIAHYDKAMEYKQNIEGNPVRIEFFLPNTALNIDEAKNFNYPLEQQYTEKFKNLWNSGKCSELEAVKKSYFAGKSLNIQDYTIMSFVGTWKGAQTNGRYFRLRDIALDQQLNEEARKVTVEYYHFDYGKDFNFDDSIYSVTWNPVFKQGSLTGVKNPEELPGDEMTVTIELQSGKVIKKVILLSFDKDGYVIAKVK